MVSCGDRGPRLGACADQSWHFWIFHLRCCSGRFSIRGQDRLCCRRRTSGVVAVEGWMLHTGFWMWAYILPIVAIVGVSNIHLAAKKRADTKLRLAHEEIEHLAKVAERERIARDLHDVLGHTLSVVVLKAELAAKLTERDAARAQREMNEVEQIAREALAEVRHAIRGYRARGLGEELARAKATLEIAAVRAECEAPDIAGLTGRCRPAGNCARARCA